MTHQLNPAQQQAVRTLSGPLLVLAGAGTGKTQVVTHRIAELIRQGTRPSRILAVTFTNKAANEMQQRVRGLLGRRLKETPEISTFHSLCVRVLRRHIAKLGYPQNFPIYARGDQETVARDALREIKVPTKLLKSADLLSMISRWKSASVRPDGAAASAQTDKEHLAAMAYRRYQRALKNAGAVDFDDLLLCTEDLFAQFADARRQEAARFDHLLIDEYQDTNASQYRIVRALAQRHGNLCVVGDDDQSIYGWRGAEVEHILRFSHDWPTATVVRLEENYRSTAEILKLANRLISYNKVRHDKVLRPARPGGEKPLIEQHKDETVEAKSVVASIRRQVEQGCYEFRDAAILFRTNEQPRAFETELRRQKVPYVLIGGMSFFDRREVRDIVAYLKLLESPQDEVSLLRIINKPPRGIGDSSVEWLRSTAVERGVTLWELFTAGDLAANLPPGAVRGTESLRQVLGRHRESLATSRISNVARGLIDDIQYESELHRIYADPNERESRWAAVQEVVNAISAYEQKNRSQATLAGFLDDIALGERESDDDKDRQLSRNAVALMTYHSAKGLEFPQVYMVGMEEGLLPHRRAVELEGAAIEEERRLCYVGITRAEQRLTLSLALTRMKWGKPRESFPSRFLYEIIGKADKAHGRPGLQRPGRAAARR